MKHINPLDLFTVGIGPSSSHTVGPMRAAYAFARELSESGHLDRLARVTIHLYGSLGATGAGHGTTNALIAGLAGFTADTCDPHEVLQMWQTSLDKGHITVLGKTITLSEADLDMASQVRLPRHSNGMKFEAWDEAGNLLLERVYFSVGGGFIEGEHETPKPLSDLPYQYNTADELLELCDKHNLTFADVAYANAVALSGKEEVEKKLEAVWDAMSSCVEHGLSTEGVLPGYLQVPRRAHAMSNRLQDRTDAGEPPGELSNEWLQAFAIAVNEENAAGMRVVTAPTNGAAGIIPAVGYFAHKFKNIPKKELSHTYLLTAAAVGTLYKMNASISGAEAGCQGEVGSACSMAAAGLTAVMGGTVQQIENAAEIAMEHNLGLTCDPVGGFVQLPCIERNAIAAGTAVAATRLALNGDGSHKISLDTVIETMRQTGQDMSDKYKETSMGGLAVNVIEC